MAILGGLVQVRGAPDPTLGTAVQFYVEGEAT